MPTFIKTGLWEKTKKGLKGWLNLDDLIKAVSIKEEQDNPVSLHLDQSVPQEVFGGAPVFDSIDFNTSPELSEDVIGRMQWSGSEKTIQFGVEGGTIDVNKEMFDIYVDDSSGGLIEGDVVSVVSISGNRQAVDLTDCTDVGSANACIGMVTNVNTNGTVRITKKGRVRKLDTGGLTEGLPVYIDPSNPGKYTQVPPNAPNYFIHVGIVEVAQNNNGIIDIDIRVSPRTTDLSDVNGTALDTDGQFGVWDNTNKYFDFTENVNNFWRYGPNTEVMWDDLRAPASGINPAGQVSPPTVSSVDGSLLFSTNDAVCVWFQLPHAWKEGSDISPHIHWAKTTSAAGTVNWQMKYKWFDIGDVDPGFSSLINGSESVPNSDTADKHSLYGFPDIDGTGKTLSSMLCIYLIRTSTGDTYGADAKLLEIDVHIQIDSIGSRQEYVK